MKSRTITRGIISRVFMVVVLAAGMASFPGQGARAAIDLTSFAAKVDFGTGAGPYDVAISAWMGTVSPI